VAQQDPEIEELVATGRKIEAIRLCRERYGVGLREAKEAVDAMERGEPLTLSPARRAPGLADDPDFAQTLDTLLRNGQTIQAIKQYRERYHVGLKEAKERVEARAAELGITARSRCFIATAAYGSAVAPELRVLRIYRDTVLRRSTLGRAFVLAYYRLSPSIAAWIARSEKRRRVARSLLDPLVRVCQEKLASHARRGA
jgi:ribosomal protein L7/L12